MLFGFHVDFWTIWGFAAQGVFFSSFVIQWLKSEKEKNSYLPKEFWYLRLLGSAMTFIYVIQRKDLVFLVATVLQSIMFMRNITLIHQAKNDK